MLQLPNLKDWRSMVISPSGYVIPAKPCGNPRIAYPVTMTTFNHTHAHVPRYKPDQNQPSGCLNLCVIFLLSHLFVSMNEIDKDLEHGLQTNSIMR